MTRFCLRGREERIPGPAENPTGSVPKKPFCRAVIPR